ncbi:MAG: hypothetical protein EXR72_11630 [Myxococcales bacterium]|nr:hypothetical protein [Myxococcales bacterium]
MAGLTIAHVMQAYAQDAIDVARERFQVDLDFSEESVTRVERCLAGLHDGLPRGLGRLLRQKKTEDQIAQMAKVWGGYLGEVIRRRWGGEWRAEASGDGKMITLRVLGADVFPTVKVFQRLTNGASDDVSRYYNVMRGDFARLDYAPDAEQLFGDLLEEEPPRRWEIVRPAVVAAKRGARRRPPPIPSK